MVFLLFLFLFDNLDFSFLGKAKRLKPFLLIYLFLKIDFQLGELTLSLLQPLSHLFLLLFQILYQMLDLFFFGQ
jgi:hypothetical protein